MANPPYNYFNQYVYKKYLFMFEIHGDANAEHNVNEMGNEYYRWGFGDRTGWVTEYNLPDGWDQSDSSHWSKDYDLYEGHLGPNDTITFIMAEEMPKIFRRGYFSGSSYTPAVVHVHSIQPGSFDPDGHVLVQQQSTNWPLTIADTAYNRESFLSHDPRIYTDTDGDFNLGLNEGGTGAALDDQGRDAKFGTTSRNYISGPSYATVYTTDAIPVKGFTSRNYDIPYGMSHKQPGAGSGESEAYFSFKASVRVGGTLSLYDDFSLRDYEERGFITSGFTDLTSSGYGPGGTGTDGALYKFKVTPYPRLIYHGADMVDAQSLAIVSDEYRTSLGTPTRSLPVEFDTYINRHAAKSFSGQTQPELTTNISLNHLRGQPVTSREETDFSYWGADNTVDGVGTNWSQQVCGTYWLVDPTNNTGVPIGSSQSADNTGQTRYLAAHKSSNTNNAAIRHGQVYSEGRNSNVRTSTGGSPGSDPIGSKIIIKFNGYGVDTGYSVDRSLAQTFTDANGNTYKKLSLLTNSQRSDQTTLYQLAYSVHRQTFQPNISVGPPISSTTDFGLQYSTGLSSYWPKAVLTQTQPDTTYFNFLTRGKIYFSVADYLRPYSSVSAGQGFSLSNSQYLQTDEQAIQGKRDALRSVTYYDDSSSLTSDQTDEYDTGLFEFNLNTLPKVNIRTKRGRSLNVKFSFRTAVRAARHSGKVNVYVRYFQSTGTALSIADSDFNHYGDGSITLIQNSTFSTGSGYQKVAELSASTTGTTLEERLLFGTMRFDIAAGHMGGQIWVKVEDSEFDGTSDYDSLIHQFKITINELELERD